MKEYPVISSGEEVKEDCFGWLSQAREPFRPLHGVELSLPSKEVVIEVNILKNDNDASLEKFFDWGDKFLAEHPGCDFLDENWIGVNISDTSIISAGGVEGIQGFGGCCGACVKELYISKSGRIYNFSVQGDIGKICDSGGDCRTCEPCCPKIDEEIYNQMLSTFRFLD